MEQRARGNTAALPLRGPAASRSTSQEYFDEIQDVKVTKGMLELAKHIVNQKAGTFDPEEFEDHYENALVQLINEKRAGKVIRPKERPKGENVVDLMDALRKSVGGAAAEAAQQKPVKKSRRPEGNADADQRQKNREGSVEEEAGDQGPA